MTMIEAICPIGNHPFTYEARRGRPRIYCSAEHGQQGWLNDRATKPLRRCSRCKQDKPQEEFAGKAASYCHTCANEYKAGRSRHTCEYHGGCDQPKVPGRGARLCAEHRASAEAEKRARALEARSQECKKDECHEPKLRGHGHQFCAKHAYAPDLTKTSAYVMANRRGMSQEEYEARVAAQGGLCALCGKPPPGKRQLSADHDHTCCPGRKSCGKCQRDLLCDRCNPMLGYAQDSIDVLEAAIVYLRKWERS